MGKKELIPKDSRYIPFVQQKYCCVPACISMIMLKRGIPLLPQELIGGELGLVIEEKDKDKFWNAKVGEPYPSGYGTNVGFEDGKINPNKAFEKLGIPLSMEMQYIDKFEDIISFTDFLENLVKNDKDSLVCFDWGTFSGNKENKWGHVCLLDKIIGDGKIRLIDPGYFEPKWEEVSIATLYDAMKVHTTKNGAGFWVVNSL